VSSATIKEGLEHMRYIDDPEYWWYRAEEFRAKAGGVREFEARCAMIDAAEACERQARLLEKASRFV
jgi:hypothetical protein